MSKNINFLFGNELKELGYKMIKVNHFEKKLNKYIFCVSKDLVDHLLLRLLLKKSHGKITCLYNEHFEIVKIPSKLEFTNILLNREVKYQNLITEISDILLMEEKIKKVID